MQSNPEPTVIIPDNLRQQVKEKIASLRTLCTDPNGEVDKSLFKSLIGGLKIKQEIINNGYEDILIYYLDEDYPLDDCRITESA